VFWLGEPDTPVRRPTPSCISSQPSAAGSRSPQTRRRIRRCTGEYHQWQHQVSLVRAIQPQLAKKCILHAQVQTLFQAGRFITAKLFEGQLLIRVIISTAPHATIETGTLFRIGGDEHFYQTIHDRFLTDEQIVFIAQQLPPPKQRPVDQPIPIKNSFPAFAVLTRTTNDKIIAVAPGYERGAPGRYHCAAPHMLLELGILRGL